MDPVTSNLIAASAGTGKTYKLASRFISLLALKYPVEKLIALTFTRNAAGEFKGRILSALAKGAASPEGAEELTLRIRETLGSTQNGNVPLCPQVAESLSLDQETYKKLLRSVVDKLSQLNLATMDSFFTKLVSTHRYELGFPSLHQMDDAELEKVRQDALRSLLYEAEASDENTEALMELCQDVSGNSKRDVFSVLNENVQEYYPLYLDTKDNAEVWGALEVFQLTDAYTMSEIRKMCTWKTAEVDRHIEAILDDYDVCVEDLLQSIHDQNVKLDRFVEKGCRKLSDDLRKRNGDISPTLCMWLYGPARGCEDEEKLRGIVRHTRDLVVLLPLVRKTLGMRNLMKRYDDQYKDEVRASGKLVFDDMPRLVADKLMNIQNEASIAYRLDGQLDHWMLDEFQDTSPGQWAALKPLLENIRSDIYQSDRQSQRSIFVVGDEKQSIYGWRGATPELFTYLKSGDVWRQVFGITLQNKSFRSAEAIMGEARFEGNMRLGFVNDLFSSIFFNDERKKEEFSRHQVSKSMLGKPGYVRVEEVSESMAGVDDGVKARERMCIRIAETLDTIQYAEKKISVAILVRSNTDVRAICQWFRNYRSALPVVPLADETVGEASLLGQLFLHFFKWLQHPGDAFRENLLRHSPLHVMDDKATAAAWMDWRRNLENGGIVRVLEMLTAGIPGVQSDRSFREWVNEARAFESGGGALDEWVRHIENQTTKSNPPKSCIHVMTFHKSKGTEYDVVFLPFSSIKAVNERLSVIKEEDYEGGYEKDTPQLRGILVRPKLADWAKKNGVKIPSESPYNKWTRRWKADLMEEALNVLYVAVTRAKHANYIFLNGYSGKGKKAHEDSYTDIIKQAMVRHSASVCEQQEEGAELSVNEWGEANWFESPEFTRKDNKQPEAQTLQMPAVLPRRKKVSPSKIDEEHAAREASFFELSRGAGEQDAAAFGTAVHALFEQVEWLGQGGLPGWVDSPRTPEECLVAAALQVPEIRSLYTRKDGQEAYNEQSIDAIAVQGGGEVWVSGTIDRLVLTRRNGQENEAHIIDFKTDIRRGDTPEEQDAHLCETHAAQMQAYRALLMRAFDLPEEAVRVTLVSCPRDGAPARAVPWTSQKRQ